MAIALDLNKTVEQNINDLYSQLKKLKAKTIKVKEVIKDYKEQKQSKQEKEQKQAELQKSTIKNTKLKEWFTKFRWFITSNNHIAIGGRDATSNEVVIKKFTQPNEIVFHTSMPGSPFFVLKEKIPELKEELFQLKTSKPVKIELEELAQATLSYSKAWSKQTLNDVFYVNVDQLSKTPEAGEYLAKGSFVIRGKRTFLKPELRLAIGLLHKDKKVIVIGGPVTAITNMSNIFVTIAPGKSKKSDTAKRIKKLLETKFFKETQLRLQIDVNDIVLFLPNGGCSVKKD